MESSMLRGTISNCRLGQDACWVPTGQVEEERKPGPMGGSGSTFLGTQVWPWDVMVSTWPYLGASRPLGIGAGEQETGDREEREASVLGCHLNWN